MKKDEYICDKCGEIYDIWCPHCSPDNYNKLMKERHGPTGRPLADRVAEFEKIHNPFRRR